MGAPAARRRRSCPRSAAARPTPGAAEEYYERNGAYPSVEINEVVAGEPRTVVPAVARATVSVRLAPGQEAAAIAPVLEGLLRDAAPADADVAIELHLADPSLFEPDLPALLLAAEALERATGTRAGAGPLRRLDPRRGGVRRPRDPHHRRAASRSPTTPSTRPTSRSSSRTSSSASAPGASC